MWPGFKAAELGSPDEAKSFGNPERNFGISLIKKDDSYVHFLDDDNAMHPEFWRQIYPLIMKKEHEFISFDQERTPGDPG